MRTINSGEIVQVHDKEIYINMHDGTGFHEIFETMAGIIKKLSFFNSNINNLEFEDACQDVNVFVLEGIFKYSHDKGAKLSTFLYTYVHNKIIDFSRKRNLLGKMTHMVMIDDAWNADHSRASRKIELTQRIEDWDDRWKNIIFKIFVKGESINDVATSEKMTRWGLSRAIRRRFKAARNI